MILECAGAARKGEDGIGPLWDGSGEALAAMEGTETDFERFVAALGCVKALAITF